MMACSQKHATNQYCNKGKPVLFPPQMLRIQQGVDAFLKGSETKYARYRVCARECEVLYNQPCD